MCPPTTRASPRPRRCTTAHASSGSPSMSPRRRRHPHPQRRRPPLYGVRRHQVPLSPPTTTTTTATTTATMTTRLRAAKLAKAAAAPMPTRRRRRRARTRCASTPPGYGRSAARSSPPWCASTAPAARAAPISRPFGSSTSRPHCRPAARGGPTVRRRPTCAPRATSNLRRTAAAAAAAARWPCCRCSRRGPASSLNASPASRRGKASPAG